MTSPSDGSSLAGDSALPHRDVLLDQDAVAERLTAAVSADGGVIGRCSLRRAKYRVGESLRVVYEVDVDGSTHVLAGRMSTGGSDAMFQTGLQHRVDVGPFGGVFHDARLNTVWWTFPNDRKLRHLDPLLGAPPGVTAANGNRWTRTELVEYAPEHCATVRVLDERDHAVAYAKAYRTGAGHHLAAQYGDAARGLRACGVVRTPRPLAWIDDLEVLVLEALPGRRWADLGPAELPFLFAGLGPAVAAFHRLDPAGRRPFARLQIGRLVHCAQLVAMARPDVADLCAALTGRLGNGPRAADGHQVLLHGDVHPGNALLDATSVNLIDLDQSGVGSAAADIGSLAARMRFDDLIRDDPGGLGADLFAAFAAGYSSIAPLPHPAVLRWYTAAALLAERAIRAVNRVDRDALPRLRALLADALTLLQESRSDAL